MNVKTSLIGIAAFILCIIIFTINPTLLIVLLVTFTVIVRWKFAGIKGAVGEWWVNKILKKLDPNVYHIYHDLYVPTEDGATSQVDHVVTSRFGIFVIETKHYEGWIFGSEKQRYWTQVIYKRKEKLFNPIWQNKGHIKALKNYLALENNEYFHSIIAFSQNSKLKFEDNFTAARVIQFPQLDEVIQEKRFLLFSESDVQQMNKQLSNLKLRNPLEKRKIKQKHVETIKRNTGKQPNQRKVVAINNNVGENNNSYLGKEVQKKTERVSEVSNSKQSMNIEIPTTKLSVEETTATTEVENIETTPNAKNEHVSDRSLCPKCKGSLSLKNGKFGTFYGCSNFPKCRFTLKA